MKRKITGIGLLELMLALAIIAMMMVAASKYYQSTQVARRAQVAVESVQAIYAAGERYLMDVGSFNFATDAAIDGFIAAGYLSNDFKSNANPWGGAIKANGALCNNRCLAITFEQVPHNDCENVALKLQNQFSVVSGVTCPENVGPMYMELTGSL